MSAGNPYRIIELAGIPGAGKTTLMAALEQQLDRVDWIILENYQYNRDLGFFLRNLLILLPIILKARGHSDQRLSRRDVAQMIMLNGLPNVARRKVFKEHKTVIFEEGHLALISQLHRRNSHLLNTPSTQQWWKIICREWAEMLDLVIELDAPADVIVARIRNREDQYEVADMSDEVAIKYFEEIQDTQERLLVSLESLPNAPRIIRFNSLKNDPEQIKNELITIFENYKNTKL